MTLYEFLKTKISGYDVSSENGVVHGVKLEEESRFELDLAKCLGIFWFNCGTVIVHLPNPTSSNYNEEMIQLITPVLSKKGLSTNYEKTVAGVRAILFQGETASKNIIVYVTELGNMCLSRSFPPLNQTLTERDKNFLSNFVNNSDNYMSGRQTIYHWENQTETLFEHYNRSSFTAGPCETVDSPFAMIISEIYRFVDHVREMRTKRIGPLNERNMELHMQKPYNTREQLENANKKRIADFCNIRYKIFDPILPQEKDFSDVEEETGDDTHSLGKKRTRS